jgi:hypothetical protein
MTARPPRVDAAPAGYPDWLAELKTRIHCAQPRRWGARVIERLVHDLRSAFPDMKGQLMYMRAFTEAWPQAEIVQQAAG